MTPMRTTIEHNLDQLLQVEELLRQLPDEELAAQRTLLFGSSIGQHLRHIIEYYDCLLRQQGTGLVSYDRRERNPLIETRVAVARDMTYRCMHTLGTLEADRRLEMESELPGADRLVQQTTSLLRELTYVADHCVHHLAMVRIVMEQELAHLTFPDHLGVAAATRNYHAR